MLEIDRDPVADGGLDLAYAPIGVARVADSHAWFDGAWHCDCRRDALGRGNRLAAGRKGSPRG